MKKYIVLLVLSIWVFSSCVKEEGVSIEERSGISLKLVCSEHNPGTKSGKDGEKDGEDPYNENSIKTIDYFFYQDGKTNENSVLHKRENVNASGSYTLDITVDASIVNSVLFANHKNKCFVAVIVNYPEQIDHSSSENTTLEDIMNKTVITAFKESAQSPIQDNFVMFGTATVDLINRTDKIVATPEVNLERVASKITVDLHVKSPVVTKQDIKVGTTTYHDVEQTWVPDLSDFSNLKIYLVNAVKRAIVSGESSSLVFGEADYFKYSSETNFTNRTTTHDSKTYFVSPPFYTYPQTWESNAATEPFIKIVLPWTRQAGGIENPEHPDPEDPEHWIKTWDDKTKQYYYRVILPNIEGFKKNNWYHLILDLEVLGSETDDKTVDITAKYYVVDWAKAEVDADIKSARYLSVSQTRHYMYNTTELKIPYVSSNPCSIVNVSVKQYDFKNRDSIDYSSVAKDNWVKLGENNTIVINHDLNNDINSSSFDVAPYEYKFTIRHSDTPGGDPYYSVIKVTQYPAMYIEQEQSNGFAYVKGVDNASNNGPIWDGQGTGVGTRPTRHETGGWWSDDWYYDVDGLKRSMGSMANRDGVNGQGDNNNQYQYTIHVTVLPEGFTSSIGDPRAPATTLSGLPDCSNYRPTDENTEDIIAPVFKIASSYGKTNAMTYDGARKRCAAYQENGYPAGRWRLPTKAEIEYLVTLSKKDKIPTLFGSEDDTGYWAAGYSFYVAYLLDFKDVSDSNITIHYNTHVPGYTVDSKEYFVYTRCVYDVWYWDDGQDTQNLTSWGGYQTTRRN